MGTRITSKISGSSVTVKLWPYTVSASFQKQSLSNSVICLWSQEWGFFCGTQWAPLFLFSPRLLSHVPSLFNPCCYHWSASCHWESVSPLLWHSHYLPVWSVSQQQHQTVPLLAESSPRACSAHICTMQCHDTGRPLPQFHVLYQMVPRFDAQSRRQGVAPGDFVLAVLWCFSRNQMLGWASWNQSSSAVPRLGFKTLDLYYWV